MGVDRYTYGGDKLISQRTLGAETLRLQSHVFFSLRIKRRVVDKTVDEDPQVILDLKRLDGHARFVLLLQGLSQLFDYQLCHMIDVSTTLSVHQTTLNTRDNFMRLSKVYSAQLNGLPSS